MKVIKLILSTLVSVWLMSFATDAAAAGVKVPYEVEGKPYEGYLVMPAPKSPFVLLIHDWDGLTGYEMKRTEMLGELGYAAFAADLFGAGVRPTGLEDKRRHTVALYQDRAKIRSLIHGALKAAKSMGASVDNAVVMGYCFGGSAVLEFARSGADVKGFVSFHGGLDTPEGQDYSKTRGRLLILHGTADESVDMNDFATLAQELEEKGVPHEMITYGGAPHAYTVFDTDRYREDADRKSWRRFTEFLIETLDR